MSIEEIAKIQTTQNTELRKRINELVQQNAELVAYCEAQQQEIANIQADAIEWNLLTDENLPPLNQPVLAFRKGDANKDKTVLAQRQHKYNTYDEWEWTETGGGAYTYWGMAVDGEITHWAYLPTKRAKLSVHDS